jgi:hypothetical protein
MAPHRPLRLRPLPLLVVVGWLSAVPPSPTSAGPLIRRAQERKACQDFAGLLRQSSGDPARAQQVYQQGVLQLVQRFGENPCGDIPAPTASAAPSAPPTSGPAPTGTATKPAIAPSQGAAAISTGAATPSPHSPSGRTTTDGSAILPAPNTQQQQACDQFAGKLQATATSDGTAAARQTYAMGLQKLTGMFGSNPCPNVRAPQ